MPDELEERTISQEERDKHPASDFAGKDRSFPIFIPEDVAAAAASLGRAGSGNYSTDELKRRIIAIAKRKGASFVARLPEAWKESNPGDDFDSGLTPLVERAVRSDNTIDLKLISPGWGASGYYSADVLREYGPSAWPAGTHMYLDHPTESEMRERPERSVRDLAAVLITAPEYKEGGPAGAGLYGKASVLPQFKEVIEALSPHIGVSIRGRGPTTTGIAEGREGRIVQAITKGESVDFVTKPGAGGTVLALMESLRQKHEPDMVSSSTSMSSDPVNYTTTTTTTGAVGSVTGTPNVTVTPAPVSESVSEEDESMELQEAQERIEALEKDLEETKTTRQEAIARAERAEGALAIIEAQGVAREALDHVELPAAAKTRIVTKVTADPPMGEDGRVDRKALTEAVDAEVKVEAEYIESVTGAGKVTDQGVAPADRDETIVKESLGKGLSKFFGLSSEASKRAVEGR